MKPEVKPGDAIASFTSSNSKVTKSSLKNSKKLAVVNYVFVEPCVFVDDGAWKMFF